MLAVARVAASVEAVEGVGDVLMVRLHEGPAADVQLGEAVRASGDAQLRLQSLLSALVDIPVILQTMPAAIKRACMVARP